MKNHLLDLDVCSGLKNNILPCTFHHLQDLIKCLNFMHRNQTFQNDTKRFSTYFTRKSSGRHFTRVNQKIILVKKELVIPINEYYLIRTPIAKLSIISRELSRDYMYNPNRT
jgi:hypothetical protein